jgi:glucosyl-dolichyl phosphate glucuronosyltransferase
MDVSVIIPTFNNAKMLASTLSAFEHVHFPEAAELIVVDNNSIDDTEKTVRQFSERLPLRYAFEPIQGISSAKNHGIRIARGALLIFTDDDVRPVDAWIATYLSAYRKNPTEHFWGGPIESEFQGALPDKRLWKFAPFSVRGLSYGTNKRLLAPDEYFLGANLACSADALSQVGLFDVALGLNPGAQVSLTGEETNLQMRLKREGYAGIYLPDASVRHVVPARKTTFKHFAARAEALGRFERVNAPFEKGKCTFRGVPVWRFRRCVEKWVKAWLKRFAGRDWHSDYILYREDRGFLLGSLKR